MTKLKASVTHLIISLFFVGILVGTVFYIWYPGPLLNISNVIEPIKVLVLVDIIVGPILTFVVYKKGKKSLKFDLSFIALVQILAYIYGANSIYQGRASLLVMSYGELVYLEEYYAKNDELKYDSLKPGLVSKPKFAILDELKSIDIYKSYAQFKPIDDINSQISESAYSFEDLLELHPDKEQEINKLKSLYQEKQILILKLNKRYTNYYFVIYSKDENKLIDMLN